MKTINPNIKIGKWINSGIFLSLQIMKNEKKLPKQYIDFLFILQCLPLNSNNEEGDEILFKRKDLFNIIVKRNKRLKFPIYYLKKKITNPFNMFFKILSYNKNPIIQHVDNDIYRLKDIYNSIIVDTVYDKLFKILITDELIDSYNGDLSKLRKDAIFLSLLELIKLCPDIILTEHQLNTIFGINSYDIANFCAGNNIDKEIIYHSLSDLEEQKLNLIPSKFTENNKYYEMPIGFTIDFKQKHLPKLIKKLSKKLKMYQINYRILHAIKTRIEDNKINYYDVEDFDVDMKKRMNRRVWFDEDDIMKSPQDSEGSWKFNRNKKNFFIMNEENSSRLTEIKKRIGSRRTQ
jgi:hypothetical protein